MLGRIVLVQLYLLIVFILSLNIGAIPYFFFVFTIPVLWNFVVSPFRERSEIRYLVVDDVGLHRRHSATSRDLALLRWGQIASFAVRECQPSERSRTTIYSVTAHDAVITWRGMHSSAHDEYGQVDPMAGVRLAQYVAALASVQPRDVTLVWDDVCAMVRWIEHENGNESTETASANVSIAIPGLERVIRDIVHKRHEPWRRTRRFMDPAGNIPGALCRRHGHSVAQVRDAKKSRLGGVHRR
jgi:hypothetical protein